MTGFDSQDYGLAQRLAANFLESIPYVCDKCPKRYKNLRSLKYHRNKECGQLFKCNICSKVYDTKCGLRTHNLLRCPTEPHLGTAPHINDSQFSPNAGPTAF